MRSVDAGRCKSVGRLLSHLELYWYFTDILCSPSFCSPAQFLNHGFLGVEGKRVVRCGEGRSDVALSLDNADGQVTGDCFVPSFLRSFIASFSSWLCRPQLHDPVPAYT
jgi:hypothetical protein